MTLTIMPTMPLTQMPKMDLDRDLEVGLSVDLDMDVDTAVNADIDPDEARRRFTGRRLWLTTVTVTDDCREQPLTKTADNDC